MLFKTILALLLISLVGADTLERHWCQCSGRDIYGTVQRFVYHSNRVKQSFSMTRTCKAPPETGSPRERCNGLAYWLYDNRCKTFGKEHKLCYDRNVWGSDVVAFDGQQTELKHKNMKTDVLTDCTATCRDQWPHAVSMTSHCNYTSVGVVVPVSKNQCKIDYFSKLKDL